MLKWKRLLALIFACASLLVCAACTQEPHATERQNADEQKAAALYNQAVERLLQTQSYTMSGSVNSSAVMGNVLTSVVTSIDCKYAKSADGDAVMLMEAEQRYDGKNLPHTTYVSGGRYYISAMDEQYFVDTNDFGDYDAAAIIKLVEDTAISNDSVDPADDGVQVRFEIPYGIYASEALDSLIGMFADDSLLQQPVVLRAAIDTHGMLQSIYLELENSTSFADELIEQSVVLSLHLTAYNETEVAAPENLADYEDRTFRESIEQNPDGKEPTEEFTGDSLD